MNKYFSSILAGVGVIVGVLFAFQMKSNPLSDSNFVVDEVAARQDLIKGFLDEQSYLQSRIVFLRGEIEEQQELIKSKITSASLERLQSLKKDIGLTNVSGRGIEITLEDGSYVLRDGESQNDGLIQAADIRDIVNILNASSVQAISVNGQRVVASSPISSVGTTILVNNSYLSPPFAISAVGDPDVVIQRLSNQSLLPELYERVRDKKVNMRIAVRENLLVPIYNGDFKYEYINTVEQ